MSQNLMLWIFCFMLMAFAASRTLATGAMSINEICQSIGFSDINNFIRYFRKEYQITPLAYRKSLK